jgi:hypothetical protein
MLAQDAMLRCMISTGQFSEEVAVSGQDYAGAQYSFFISRKFVEFEGEPARGCEVDGWLRVRVLDRKQDLVLVRLPGRTFENGSTITVHQTQLDGSHLPGQPV